MNAGDCRRIVEVLTLGQGWEEERQALIAIREFAAARSRLRALLDVIGRDGGLVEAPEFRPRAFGYRVSARAMRRRIDSGRDLPWGWVCYSEVDRAVRGVGPLWMLGPGMLYRWLHWRLIEWAVRHDLAREPYEGCYYHDLRWFPDQPRFQ